MESDRQRRGATFDRVAALYDETRPGYPEGLIDAVAALGGPAATARILEVGCGPGNATLPLARRGYEILALEPGAALAALARRHCAAFERVRIEQLRFEDWDEGALTFDLLISAQAWHWVDPATGDPKAAAVLRPGGAIALFWNRPRHTKSALRDALDAVYAEVAPQLGKAIEPGGRAATNEPIDRRLRSQAAFEVLEPRSFPWTACYATARYLRLMETQSDHQLLPPDTRARLFEGLQRAIDEAGGSIAVEYDAVLLAARRRG